jgi:hypothetical protein
MEKIKKSIKQFLYSKVCGKERLRPAQQGLFYEGCNIVATNGGILVILKAEYEPEYEGKIIDRKGAIIEEVYPSYASVVSLMNSVINIYETSQERVGILEKCLLEIPDELFQITLLEGINDFGEPSPLVVSVELLGQAFKLFSLIGETPKIYARAEKEQVLTYVPLMLQSESCTIIITHSEYFAENTYHFDLLW